MVLPKNISASLAVKKRKCLKFGGSIPMFDLVAVKTMSFMSRILLPIGLYFLVWWPRERTVSLSTSVPYHSLGPSVGSSVRRPWEWKARYYHCSASLLGTFPSFCSQFAKKLSWWANTAANLSGLKAVWSDSLGFDCFATLVAQWLTKNDAWVPRLWFCSKKSS